MNKKLTKSNSNIVISGTLAGIAEYFGIDPTIVRVIFVIVTLAGIGSPVLLYLILMMIIPKSNVARPQNYGHNNSFYQANSKTSKKEARKDVTNSVKEDTSDDDWSDF